MEIVHCQVGKIYLLEDLFVSIYLLEICLSPIVSCQVKPLTTEQSAQRSGGFVCHFRDILMCRNLSNRMCLQHMMVETYDGRTIAT
jgi:hypothetical protein